MRPLSYSLEFRGFASERAPQQLDIWARAPSSSFITLVTEAGLFDHKSTFGYEEAALRATLAFDSDDRFVYTGTVVVGRGNVMHFRTAGPARLDRSSGGDVREATAALLVEGGQGQFFGAVGRIASNFLISDTFDVTDRHLGLIYVRPNPRLSEADIDLPT